MDHTAIPNLIFCIVHVNNAKINMRYNKIKILRIFPQRILRFTRKFPFTKGVNAIELNGNIFVLINSMAMERDGCQFCAMAERELEKVFELLRCTKNYTNPCKRKLADQYSKPILMQHFPLFRFSFLFYF